MISLGIGLNGTRGRGGWSPAKLDPLFWAGSLDPASGRMWQDSAGVTPVTTFGQPVGRLLSSVGSIAALQATALSRPTTVRWPKGGRRNLLLWTEDGAQWTYSGSPYSGNPGWRQFEGIAQDSQTRRLVVAEYPAGSTVIPGQYIGRMMEVLPLGAARYVTIAATDNGLAEWFDMQTESFVYNQKAQNSYRNVEKTPDGWFRLTVISPATSIGSMRNAIHWGEIAPETSSGTTGSHNPGGSGVVVRNPMVQTFADAAADPMIYQRVTTANDVTQAGVASVGHLLDDGGDSLPAIFPAGSLYLAYVDHLGAVSYTTATSDGIAGTDLLLAERTADVIVRGSDFSADEKPKLEAYWAKRIAA